MNETLGVAGLSARLMAQSARRGGFRVIAMDVFGDLDTQRAASAWMRIGEPSTMQLDPARTLAAIEALAGEPELLGWIAGAGFEAIPDTHTRAAEKVPLIGNPLAVSQRVRDPALFFATLDALRVPHPETARVGPDSPTGWLVKDAGGSGAWHIRPAGPEDARRTDLAPGIYYQRCVPGRSHGVLFVANRRRAHVVGITEQTIRARRGHPYVYCGMLGPVQLPERVMQRIDEALQVLVADVGLTGLNSLDFLLDGDDFFVLEVNARPSSSVALFDAAYDRGLVHAHVAAHLHGALPAPPSATLREMRGNEIVFADAPCRAKAAAVERLLAAGWCHDIPQPDTQFGSGEPVCTVSAQAPSRAELRALIDARCDEARSWLETT